MKRYTLLLLCSVLLLSCQKEKEQPEVIDKTPVAKPLAFTTKSYDKKTSLPCKEPCANVTIDVPVAQNLPVVADSINKKVFSVVKSIIFFGEKPYSATTYDQLAASFIGSYDELKTKYPNDELLGWEGKVKGTVNYKSDSIINIKINHYTNTGGAHGYAGERSLIFNAHNGKSLAYTDIFKDVKAFKAFAEKKFRAKYKIPAGKSINSTGLTFEDDKFILPQNIFYTNEGLLLLYNTYESGSYAEGAKEVPVPYSEADAYLKIK